MTAWDWLIEADAPPVIPASLARLLDDLDHDDEAVASTANNSPQEGTR